MQVQHKKPGPDPLGATTVKLVREEANRTLLVEKNQPKRSIFSIGDVRHNVHSKESRDNCMKEALDSTKVTVEPQRLIEWKEPNINL